jgi:PAS domain S-box-containing protein
MPEIVANLFVGLGSAVGSSGAEWPPELAWLDSASDILIGLAATAIAFLLLYIVCRRRCDVPFCGMFILFGVFLMIFGVTHLLEVMRFYNPVYRFAGLAKLVAASVSCITLVGLLLLLPKATALQSPMALERTIAERQRAEAALRESEERFRLLLENVRDYAIYMLDPAGRVESWSAGAERLKGYSPEEILGQHFGCFFPGEDVQSGKPGRMLEAATAVGSFEQEGWLVRKDGSRFLANVLLTALRDRAGRLRGFSAVTRDITQRRLAEEKLKVLNESLEQRLAAGLATSEQQSRELALSQIAMRNQTRILQLILHGIGDAVVVADADGRFLLVNPAAERMFGLGTPEMTLDEWRRRHDCYLPDQVTPYPLQDWPLERTLRGEGVDNAEVFWRPADHPEGRWLNAVGRPLRDENNELRGGVVVFRDVTAHRRAEEQIKSSLREKELLLKEIHHRVKNNLQVIYSLLSLQSDYVKDQRSLELFRESQNRIKSMALIHQELYKSGDVETVDFAAYVHDLAANLFRSYGVRAHVIRTRIEITGILLPLQTAIPCGLILNELVTNALKYAFPAGRSGEIRIAFSPDPADGFILTIADDGIGLPKDIDFRNTESLGLRLVVTLVQQLKGAIELLPGPGTEFCITFAGTGARARGVRHDQEHDLGCRG